MTGSAYEPLTLCYKRRGDVEVLLDAWAPANLSPTVGSENQTTGLAGEIGGKRETEAPAVVFFHGGGLTVGNRKSWFPEWFWSASICRGFFVA